MQLYHIGRKRPHSRKRKFNGNRFSIRTKNCSNTESSVSDNEVEIESRSSKKLNLSVSSATSLLDNNDSSDFNVIINFNILSNLFEKYSRYNKCTNTLTIFHSFEKRNGFAQTFSVKCEICETDEEFCTSPDVNDLTAKRETKEVNMRGVMTFRIGSDVV